MSNCTMESGTIETVVNLALDSSRFRNANDNSGNMLRMYYHRDGLLAAQSMVWPEDRKTPRSLASQ